MRRLLTGVTAAALALSGWVAISPPASAAPGDGPCLGCGNANVTDAGLLARARSQVNELNGTNARQQTCTDEDDMFPEDGNDIVEKTGVIQWTLTLNDQVVWDDDDTTTGYRLECHLPGWENGRPGFPGLYDGLIEVRIFDAISPRLVAQVALDQMIAQIPTQDIHTSPAVEGLVGVETWFWIDGVDDDGVSVTAEVPGIVVDATALPSGLQIDTGDGTTLQCPDRGTEYAPGATSSCTHTYEVADEYTVSTTIMWTGFYYVNGAGPYNFPSALARTASIDLPVSEAQALNTGG